MTSDRSRILTVLGSLTAFLSVVAAPEHAMLLPAPLNVWLPFVGAALAAIGGSLRRSPSVWPTWLAVAIAAGAALASPEGAGLIPDSAARYAALAAALLAALGRSLWPAPPPPPDPGMEQTE